MKIHSLVILLVAALVSLSAKAKMLFFDDFNSQDPNWGLDTQVFLTENSPHVDYYFAGADSSDADHFQCPGGNAEFPHPSGSLLHMCSDCGRDNSQALRLLVKRGCLVGKIYAGMVALRFTDRTRKEIYAGFWLKWDKNFHAIRSGDQGGIKAPIRFYTSNLTHHNKVSSWVAGTKRFKFMEPDDAIGINGHPPNSNLADDASILTIRGQDLLTEKWFYLVYRVKMEDYPGAHNSERDVWVNGVHVGSARNEPSYIDLGDGRTTTSLFSIRLGMGNSNFHSGYECTEYCGFTIDDYTISEDYIPYPGGGP